ncbi:MAG: prolyl oligopeptidase family serine peptidase [Polyangiaceae bacterium]|nr:prolyl oligopeptidase family serine peptidase [Polyangiaceae bacterium]
MRTSNAPLSRILGLLAATSTAAVLLTNACSSPSEAIDGGDLLGVYDKDAGSDAAVQSDAKPPKDGGKPAKVPTVPTGPTKERRPVTGTCVAKQGEADHELRRTLGRPACRTDEIIETKDTDGSPRYACLLGTRGAEARAPLPLVIFFHGPEGTPAQVDKRTAWRKLAAKFDVSGDAAHPGFVLLMPQGRLLKRDKTGAIFDSDFVGENNVDVAFVDALVADLQKRGLIDKKRVYTLGESKGGLMAATYAMLRADKVAAFAAFASEAPPASWTCTDAAPPPALLLYRACDSVTPCDSVEAWARAREKQGAETVSIRLGDANDLELHCALKNKCTKNKGKANHERWPKGREEDILRFFAKHALSSDAADPAERVAPDASAP